MCLISIAYTLIPLIVHACYVLGDTGNILLINYIEHKQPILLLDVGTIYSRVGVYLNGMSKLVPTEHDHDYFPSTIVILNGNAYFGEEARQ